MSGIANIPPRLPRLSLLLALPPQTPLPGVLDKTLAWIENLCYIKNMIPKQVHLLYALLTNPAATRPLFRSSIVFTLFFYSKIP